MSVSTVETKHPTTRLSQGEKSYGWILIEAAYYATLMITLNMCSTHASFFGVIIQHILDF